MAFIERTMTTSQNGGKAIPDTSPREYLIRVVDPAGDHFAAIDQMHEGQRRHPRTVEEKSGDWRLWQLLEHKDYQGGLHIRAHNLAPTGALE